EKRDELGPPPLAQPGVGGVTLELVRDPGPVRVGDRIKVRLEVDAREPLSHVPLQLRFDPTALQLVKWTAGEILGGGAQSEILAYEAEPGLVLLGASRLGAVPGVTGRGTVIELELEALTATTSKLSLDNV